MVDLETLVQFRNKLSKQTRIFFFTSTASFLIIFTGFAILAIIPEVTGFNWSSFELKNHGIKVLIYLSVLLVFALGLIVVPLFCFKTKTPVCPHCNKFFQSIQLVNAIIASGNCPFCSKRVLERSSIEELK